MGDTRFKVVPGLRPRRSDGCMVGPSPVRWTTKGHEALIPSRPSLGGVFRLFLGPPTVSLLSLLDPVPEGGRCSQSGRCREVGSSATNTRFSVSDRLLGQVRR